MMRNMRRGIPSLFKAGTSHLTGLQEAIINSLRGAKKLAEITRTSLGPNGMNKMIINHLGKTFVTSDTATIMNEMEVVHPAAKMVVMAAQMQEKEVGDGSNFVICFAGELLAKAEELLRMGLHPSEIITGYEKAIKRVTELLEELVIDTVSTNQMTDPAIVSRGILCPLSAKQHGYDAFLAKLITEACIMVMPKNRYNFNVDNVRVAKVMGGHVKQSEVVKGMVIARDTEGAVNELDDANIACFTCSLAATETETKHTVMLENAQQLLDYSLAEEKDMEEMIQSIADSGVNCIVTGGAIDDMAAHFLEKHKIMVLKLTSKFELRRLCRTVGARPLVTLGPVNKEHQGFCKRIFVKEYGLKKVTVFQQNLDETGVSTVLLRASTQNTLADLERAVDDGVNTVKAMGREGRFLAGAGAVEIELARRLAEFGATTSGLDQYAIKAFAEAFEVVPRTLAENAGLSSMEMVSKLYAAHEAKDENAARVGLDITGGKVRDMTAKDNLLDLLPTKRQAIALAADVAITILRVDKIIQAKMAGGPKMQQRGDWDQD